MVELGNHQGRPPGCQSTVTSSSIMDQWMNREINLDILEQSPEFYPISQGGIRASNELYAIGGGNTFNSVNNGNTNTSTGQYSMGEPTLEELRFDSPLSFEKDFFYIEGTEGLNQYGRSNNETFKDITDKIEGNEHSLMGYSSWGAPMDIDALKLEEVFQVDQSDLVQGPTLAELNSNDEPLFDLEFGYDLMKDFNQYNSQAVSEKNKCTVTTSTAPTINNSQPVPMADVKIPLSIDVVKIEKDFPKYSTSLPENVTKIIPKIKIESEDDPNVTPVKKVQIMNRSPTLAPAHIVAARLAGRERQRSGLSISSISSLSSLSNDEGFGSQAEEEEEDDDEDSDAEASSDEDSYINVSSKGRSKSFSSDLNRPTTSGVVTKSSKSKSTSRKKRYFWQYNIQSKGPKVCIPSQVLPGTALDPHVLDDALDPVFSPECSLEGVKHAGKARRGDGNDLTPCPRKLHNIGIELSSLNDMINDLTPVSDVPFNVRPKSRKEKNKLASRACRLKKKAQHEANKLKLYGLQKEHRAMVALIPEVRQMLRELLSLDNSQDNKGDDNSKSSHFQDALNKLLARKSYLPVAGNTAEFVNQVLDKVAAGDPNGGLNDL